MNRLAFLKLANAAETIGEYALADRLFKLAQTREFERATGDEMDAIHKDLKAIYKKEKLISADMISDLLRSKYRMKISPQRLSLLMKDYEKRRKMNADPYVDRVGALVLEKGLDAYDIETELKGELTPDEIYDRWKTFVRQNPKVRLDLLRRPDYVYARPRQERPEDVEAREKLKQGVADGLSPTEVMRLDRGEASGHAKIRMRNDEELDEAAIETYRLSLLPEFQRPDGSPDVDKLVEVLGGTDKIVKRRLERVRQRIMPGFGRILRDQDDRAAARDMVSELAGKGYGERQLIDALNEMRLEHEPEWTDNNLFGLFGYTAPDKKRKVVPVNRWPDYRDFLEEQQQQDRIASKIR